MEFFVELEPLYNNIKLVFITFCKNLEKNSFYIFQWNFFKISSKSTPLLSKEEVHFYSKIPL